MQFARNLTRAACRGVACLAVCLMLAAGCGRDTKPAPDSGEAAPGGGAASLCAFPDYGFTIQVPSQWQQGLVIDTPRLRFRDPRTDELAATTMLLPGPLGTAWGGLQALARGGVTLPARFLSGEGDVIQVEIHPGGRARLADYVQSLMAIGPRRRGNEDFGHRETTVGNRPAIRRDYSSDGGTRRTAAYYLSHQRRVYVLVCQSPSERFEKMQPAFEKVVAGFQLVDTASASGAPSSRP